METHGLLPTNHFGARKQIGRASPAASQENTYTTWRSRKVVSLVSSDVKGAYNGVCKDRLLERLTARDIPPCLVNWIDAFCSEPTASIVVNGRTSELSELE